MSLVKLLDESHNSVNTQRRTTTEQPQLFIRISYAKVVFEWNIDLYGMNGCDGAAVATSLHIRSMRLHNVNFKTETF